MVRPESPLPAAVPAHAPVPAHTPVPTRRDSKLTMLLRESLGNVNCRTTMIAHISAAAGSYAETLSTVQIASRVLRMKKKKTKVGARRMGPAQWSPHPRGGGAGGRAQPPPGT